MKPLLFAVVTAFGLGVTAVHPASAHQEARHLDLQLLDVREIPKTKIDGLSIKELSGLGWDDDEQVLYAVSDKGRIIHLSLIMDGSRISQIAPLKAYLLTDAHGTPLAAAQANAEGIAVLNGNNGVKGDSELLVVTEFKPEIARYRPDGRRIAMVDLPASIAEAGGIEHGLESVAYHPSLGVITAPAKSLEPARSGHTLYSSGGCDLRIPGHPAGSGKVKALEVLQNGKLIVMERLGKGSKGTRSTAFRFVDPAICTAGSEPCPVVELSPQSMALPEANFEGFTMLPNGLWAAVSDDFDERGLRRNLFAVFRLTLGGAESD